MYHLQHDETKRTTSPSPSPPYNVEDAPFSCISKLLERLESFKTSNSRVSLKQRYSKTLTTFFNQFCGGDLYILFRLLLPSLDWERRYSIREYRLSRLIIKILNLPPSSKNAKNILNWRISNPSSSLSLELERILKDNEEGGDEKSGKQLTISYVNILLDQLSLGMEESLTEILSSLSAVDSKWIIRIILKDLQLPFLKACTLFSSFHTLMPMAFQVHNDLKVLCSIIPKMIEAGFKGGAGGKARLDSKEYRKLKKDFLTPLIGSPLAPMQCGRCLNGMKTFMELNFISHELLFVESKFDGERIQIHYQHHHHNGGDDDTETTKVLLFSKSGRNSTEQRKSCIPGIIEALKHNHPLKGGGGGEFSLIMEGELLVWLEEEERIEPFGSVQTLNGEGDGGDGRHLFILLFDIMMINSTSFLDVPLQERRKRLQQLVRPKKSHLELSPFNLIKGNDWKFLEDLYTTSLSRRQEGLVVKRASSPYVPWSRDNCFKIKQDYIEGFGDCIDLAVIGVKKNSLLYDEFIVACMDSSSPVDFRVMMSITNGLNKEELEKINDMISSGRLETFLKIDDLPHYIRGKIKASMVDLYFGKPFIVEILSSGWVLSTGEGGIWTPRHARIKRVYIGNSCSNDSIMTWAELQDIGRRVGGGGGGDALIENENVLKAGFEKRLSDLGKMVVAVAEQGGGGEGGGAKKIRRKIEEREIHYYSYKGIPMNGGGVLYEDLASLLGMINLEGKVRVIYCDDNDKQGVKCLLGLFKRKITTNHHKIEIWTKGGDKEIYEE